MVFKKERDFADALVDLLTQKYGWDSRTLDYCTEDDLWANWAEILFHNNQGHDQLNHCPLTAGEMFQIREKISQLHTPVEVNEFINGKVILIKRDNPDDEGHLGKEVALHIYDRSEIAAGKSVYQIAREPKFRVADDLVPDRRGDLMLLINGMPVIHIELKRSGVSVGEACRQIRDYAYAGGRPGVFTGLFSLVQIFVAMNPDDAVYFASPGPDREFDPRYYFHWADVNNERVGNYADIAEQLLSIPMAHQLIGFYTVADRSDGVLKVMRSYQYYAARFISETVARMRRHEKNQRGGYIWHTTGSGKTLTSFKAAQLIADSGDADKVIFLTDRIELGTQSLNEFRLFAHAWQEVQATENTAELKARLMSDSSADMLIVTSIQKMSRIKTDENGMNRGEIEGVAGKKLVFIIDEAHRSVFGAMLQTIRETFVYAMFFGFTGTPIHEENRRKDSTTATIFGHELHRYSIADGLRDKNVLGFDPCQVLTFKDDDLREQVALMKSRAHSRDEAMADPRRKKIYLRYMDKNKVRMTDYTDAAGRRVYGIEHYIPRSQYLEDSHTDLVVDDIRDNFARISLDGRFHALFAASSVLEAISYYRKLKIKLPEFRITCLFEPGGDRQMGDEDADDYPDDSALCDPLFRENGLREIISDYNDMFGTSFSITMHTVFKKDLADRLAHKGVWQYLDRKGHEHETLHLVIVVEQLLTGFDSRYINALYLDKLLYNENVIQAFSRTNRLMGPAKPFGIIRYYRKPHTMKKNIESAVKLYSGDRPFGLFVDKLGKNLKKLNAMFSDIKELYVRAGIENFERLPDAYEDRRMFRKLFEDFEEKFEAVRVQGFTWQRHEYALNELEPAAAEQTVSPAFTEHEYLALYARYRELCGAGGGGGGGGGGAPPLQVEGHLTAIQAELINAEYMEKNFQKWALSLQQPHVTESERRELEASIHLSFSALTPKKQKIAHQLLLDIKSGQIELHPGKTLQDYISARTCHEHDLAIQDMAGHFGLDWTKLKHLINLGLPEHELYENGRLQHLVRSVDRDCARRYLERKYACQLNEGMLSVQIEKELKDFILGWTGKDLEALQGRSDDGSG